MSHEIRTPMHAIVGISEILLHEGSLTAQQRKYIGDIKISSDALLTIINDILDLSKLESGKMPLVLAPFNLPLMLKNVVSLVAHLAGEKGLAFHYELEGDIPLSLYGDDIRLRQVLLNVLGNAVKFTERGSVSLRLISEAETLRFVVTDTGIGIKAESLPFLFEPFKQIDSGKNRHIRGTGLGLSICRNLLELMNGRIELESRYGRGSVFTITIPKVPGEIDPAPAKSIDRGAHYQESCRVLIVDDNEINLSVAAGLLKTLHGLKADSALSGPEAIEKARLTKYDLIFMDYMMPEMDGLKAAEHIRHLGGTNASTPIIALTANVVSGAREMLRAGGMDDFLLKPIRKGELDRILSQWLPEEKRLETIEPSLPPPGRDEAAAAPHSSGAGEGVGPDGPAGPESPELLDVAAGLAAVAGQRAVYERALRLLRRNLPRMIDQLVELLAAGAAEAFLIHVHGVKSSLASLGAVGLSALARDLERAAAAGDLDHCRAALPALVQRLEEMARRLDELLSEPDEAGERPAGDVTLLADSLRQLHLALRWHDYGTVTDSLRNLLAREYGPAVDPVLDRIKNHIDQFEYDAAKELLAASFPESLPSRT